MEKFSNLDEKRVSGTEVYSGCLLHVFRDDVILPDGRRAVREYMRHNGAVCIAAMSDDGRIYMEKQYRYPIGRVLYELPAGKLDSKSEVPLDAAMRELREETGLVASQWTYMGAFIPSCGCSDEVIHFYLAKGLSAGCQELDDGEFLNVEQVPFDDVLSDVLDGRIEDGKTQALVMKLAMTFSAADRKPL